MASLITIACVAMMITVFGGTMDFISAKNLSFKMAIVQKSSPHFNISLMPFHAGQEQLELGFNGEVEADVTYLVSTNIGAPRSLVRLSLDTGSDVTWLQCKPCIDCFNKNNPLFDPIESSTFNYTMCESKHCEIFASRLSPACGDYGRCQFSFQYQDKSSVLSYMASDYFELEEMDDIMAFDYPLYFGCAFSTFGDFHNAEDGVLGLGQGQFSIISQLNITKFSHCLRIPRTHQTSYISFGDEAILVGTAVPLIQNAVLRSQYIVNFHSMKVIYDDRQFKLNVRSNVFAMDKNGRGGLVLDFGTTLTFIPAVAFDELGKVLARLLSRANMRLIPVTEPRILYCFQASLDELEDIALVFNFDSINTINITLTGEQLFFPHYLKDHGSVQCLTISVSSGKESIFGAYAQAYYNIGYDLENQMVTFKEMNC